MPTDEAGRFCMQAALPVDRCVAHVAWRGSPLVDAAMLDVRVDLTLRSLELGFSPEPGAVVVDGAPLVLDAVATIDDDGSLTGGGGGGLALVLTDERGTELASGTTNGSGRLRLSVDPSRLGPPGRGELRLAFDGAADIAKSAHVARIERRAHVVLSVPQLGAAAPVSGAPEEGVALAVAVRTMTGKPVPTGSVEALLGSSVVGAAPVEAGTAHVVATFAPPEAASAEPRSVALRLRYAPDAPWYVQGQDVVALVPIRGASPWQKVALVAAGLAVAAWLALGRAARARTLTTAPVAPRKPLSQGEAKIDVVRSVRSSRAGWVGRVVDAHDGAGVSNARVTIERPSFHAIEVIASATANEAGRFELRARDARAGDSLVIEAPLHSVLRRPLPPFGEIEITLVLRRRALLDRLVRWARGKGRPFDARPEPTPGHVRRAAGNDLATARWADAVERAAFGPDEVGGAVEQEVDRLAPSVAETAMEGAKTIVDAEPPFGGEAKEERGRG